MDGIPHAPTGVTQIEVMLDIDANGIMNVSVQGKSTGVTWQRVEISFTHLIHDWRSYTEQCGTEEMMTLLPMTNLLTLSG